MSDFTIGQYYPENSIIHRLDPRVKLFGTLVFIVMLFVVNNFTFGAVGSALASILWSLGGWSYVMIAASAVSVAALIVWLFSRNGFRYADEALQN